MSFVRFTGLQHPCTLVGVYTRFALRGSHQHRYSKLINNPREVFRRTLVQPLSSACEPKRQGVHGSDFGLAGQFCSFRKFHVISHSSVILGCPSRVFGTLGIKPHGMVMFAKAYSTDHTDSSSTQKPPKNLRTHIEAFFAKYPGFDYDPTKPCMDEFKRLRKWAGWSRKSEELEEARKGMNEAMTEQFNAIYGKDPNDIATWRNLCSVLDLAEIPTEIPACKKLIRSLYINIVDLVDQPVTDVRVGYFRTERELARYTREHEKFYSLQAAKAGGLLKHLLCFVEQPRRKALSNLKLRKA